MVKNIKNEAKIKAKELVAKMTVEEKISQLLYTSAPIERLGIKAYNWWNEGSHGVARSGTATVFPHAIAMAATFNPELVNTVADVISAINKSDAGVKLSYSSISDFLSPKVFDTV